MMTTQYPGRTMPPPIHQPPPGPPGGGGPPGAPNGAGGAAGQGGKDDSYFTESRKGEVNELRQLLRTFATEKDKQRKRDIMKKVIGYMTLGIDVSRLFTEMMLAIETRDLVIKKMVYLFLCNYAETHPDLAQMCTNTLVKDSGNEDPMVRGLALRALCSLRLPQMIEYTSEPLRRSLQDGHAYVRKTGVMGILKMYHLNREEFDKAAFNDILYDMLRDPDPSVVTNCILVLNEIMADSGGMALNRAVMLHLLNRIHEFSEFGILAVLDLVPRYIPANDEGKFKWCLYVKYSPLCFGGSHPNSFHKYCRGVPNNELIGSCPTNCE
jgi:vesicle coat complex subunit